MRDLRPISLCNVLYKIVSKVLANRSKLLIGKCIFEEQAAFIPGHSIVDNAHTTFGIMHFLKCKASGKMVM